MTSLLCIITIVAQLAAVAQSPPSPPAAADRVEIVIFSDFQCPFCAQFAQSFRELQSKGIDGVKMHVQFKHFPLDIHPAARLAHQAALAAGEQGKFWEMHDLLFSNQSAVKLDDLMRYATRLELDLDRFRKGIGLRPYQETYRGRHS